MNYTDYLATSPTILAIVNLLALIGGAFLTLSAIRWMWRFGRDAYQTSIKSAFGLFKRSIDFIADLSAKDPSYFISWLVLCAALTALGIAGLVLISILSISAPGPGGGAAYAKWYARIALLVYGLCLFLGLGSAMGLSRLVLQRKHATLRELRSGEEKCVDEATPKETTSD